MSNVILGKDGKLRGSGKNRRVLRDIPYYPSPMQLYQELLNADGWDYAQNKEFYLCRDRALVSILYLGCLRISEALRIRKNQFEEKRNYILIREVKLSKSRVKDKPRRIQFRDVRLPLEGKRQKLTSLVLNYTEKLGENAKLFNFGEARAWQIVKALMPNLTPHWLRAYGEDFLYDAWDHDLLAVADYVKVDPRTLQEYLRKRHERYEVV